MSWHERPYAGGDSGGGGWRFAENPLTWAPSIGRVAGIRIRLHFLFILYIVFELLKSPYGLAFEAQYLFVLFGSVFLHELGHCFAARHVGGRADEVLLWPLGGLAFVDAPRRPWPQFVTVVWGPMVNVLLAAAAWIVLRFATDAPDYARSFHPFAPLYVDFDQPLTSFSTWVGVIFRLNYAMLLFNMLCPMYPMDAGRILQAALWPKLGYARSMLITTTVGMFTAIGLGLLAVSRDGGINFTMLSIAMLGYMICLQERQVAKAGMSDGGFGDFEFSSSAAPAERPKREGWLTRWRRRRIETQRRQAREHAAREQAEVDRILAKVHDHGLASLSRGERRTLETATRRQREQESSVR